MAGEEFGLRAHNNGEEDEVAELKADEAVKAELDRGVVKGVKGEDKGKGATKKEEKVGQKELEGKEVAA